MDKRYLHKRWTGERWSTMKFPCEEVTAPEMELWCRAIAQVVSHGPAQASLGTFKVNGHKLWEWRVVETRGRLYRKNGDQVEVYGHVRWSRYKHIRTSCSGKMCGDMATVEEGMPGMKKVCSVAPPPIRPIPPTPYRTLAKYATRPHHHGGPNATLTTHPTRIPPGVSPSSFRHGRRG